MLDSLMEFFREYEVGARLRDLLDIFIVAYVVYRALLVIKGTRAMQMGIGLGVVFLVYLGAKFLHLVTLLNLLSGLLSSIILVVVVVFQNDIRRALIRVGGRAWFTAGREQQSRVIDEVVGAATELARHRVGAIIAFEQDANLLEFTRSEGIVIDAAVSRELLVAMFYPESMNKLHDGAVLIRDLKIARAGMFFPMPETKILDASLGSRHRAALGITEETDAVVVVVSEERGTISFCFSGNIVSNLDGQSLRQALLGLFGRTPRKKGFSRVTELTQGLRKDSNVSRPTSTRPSTATPTPAAPSIKTPLPSQVKTPTPPIAKTVAVPSASTPMRTSTPSPASGRDGGPVSVRDGARSDSVPPPSDRRGSGPPPSPREPVEDTPSTGEAEARDGKRAKDAKGKTPKLTSKPAKDGEEAAEGEAAGAEVEAEGADDDAPPPSAPPRATFVPRTGEAKPADSSGSPKGSGS